MKILLLFFSMYLLGLSLVPCGDTMNFIEDHTTSVSYQQEQDHKDHHNDMCSPFCACNCCRVTTDAVSQTEFFWSQKILTNFETKFPFRSYSLISMCDKNIWQPPKITA